MLQIDIETLDAWQILACRRQRAWRGNAQDSLRTGRGVLDRTVVAAKGEQPLLRCFSRGRGQGWWRQGLWRFIPRLPAETGLDRDNHNGSP